MYIEDSIFATISSILIVVYLEVYCNNNTDFISITSLLVASILFFIFDRYMCYTYLPNHKKILNNNNIDDEIVAYEDELKNRLECCREIEQELDRERENCKLVEKLVDELKILKTKVSVKDVEIIQGEDEITIVKKTTIKKNKLDSELNANNANDTN